MGGTAKALSVGLQPIEVSGPREFESELSGWTEKQIGGLVILDHPDFLASFDGTSPPDQVQQLLRRRHVHGYRKARQRGCRRPELVCHKVSGWPIASFRCDAEFVRNRGITDMGRLAAGSTQVANDMQPPITSERMDMSHCAPFL
jgi:hypothetical protein